MNVEIKKIIEGFSEANISDERKNVLKVLSEFIKKKILKNETIRLNFICTHNSRRSHLSQIWAQTMAYYFNLKNIFCYSGGTEATALFPKVLETLINQGFLIKKLSENTNPVYFVKFSENEAPLICFSKIYFDEFNPKSNFAAVLTCSHADENCPLVIGSEERFTIKYEDPKVYDNSELQTEKYLERSLQIAQEMWYVFKNI